MKEGHARDPDCKTDRTETEERQRGQTSKQTEAMCTGGKVRHELARLVFW